MKKDNVIRQIDELGRVVIPKDIRRAVGLEIGDSICFSAEGDRIIISRPQKVCTLCGSKYELIPHLDKYVCGDCLKMLHALKDD